MRRVDLLCYRGEQSTHNMATATVVEISELLEAEETRLQKCAWLRLWCWVCRVEFDVALPQGSAHRPACLRCGSKTRQLAQAQGATTRDLPWLSEARSFDPLEAGKQPKHRPRYCPGKGRPRKALG